MINKKYLYFLLLIALLLVAGERSIKVWELDNVQDTKRIFVQVFDGVVSLPTEFTLFWKGRERLSTEDITFFGSEGEKVILGHAIESVPEFYQYLIGGDEHENICGVKVARKKSDGVVVLYDKYDYIMFVGVDNFVIERTLKDLCRTSID